MAIAIFPVLVLLGGLLLWALASNAKLAEAGRLLFFAGAFVITWVLASHVVHIG